MSDDYERTEALAAIVRERTGINRELLVEALQCGFIDASERKYGSPQDIRVHWDQRTEDVRFEALKKVVKKVEPGMNHLQTTITEAKTIDPDAEIGDEVGFSVSISDFSRSAVNIFRAAYQRVLGQAERKQVFKDYSDRIGQLIPRCKVRQIYRGAVNVAVAGSIEAIIPYEERARNEELQQGDTVLPILLEVKQPDSEGPQLILSRRDTRLIERLFEREAPEIEEAVVEIRSIAREAGVRTKIAVVTNENGVDAVGTFVGMKGIRVQSVMRALNEERIDILPWSIDKKILVTSALLPATVLDVSSREELNEETGKMERVLTAVVADDEVGRAKGSRGHNVRLAGKLVGCRIEIEERSKWEERKRFDDMLVVDIEDVPGISTKLAEKLTKAGFDSARRLLDGSKVRVLEVEGLGEVTYKKILNSARSAQEMRAEMVAEEKEKAAEEQLKNEENNEVDEEN